jgi:branched-chain amino acid transport system permease protein
LTGLLALTTFGQLTVSGLALGCLYALIALGFVIVLKSSGVLNLYQGGFILLGAYATYQFHVRWGVPFVLAVVAVGAGVALLGVAVEFAIVRRLRGSAADFAVVLVTIGLLLATESLVAATWGYDRLDMKDPWGLKNVYVGSVAISHRDIWVVGSTVVVLGAFFALFKYSRVGIAMRAAASDREAAYAQGISPNLIMGLSWAIAGILGALTGVAMGTAVAGGLSVGIDQIAFAALAPVIFGGLTSPAGAVIGGIVVGLAQLYAAGYAPDAVGEGFPTVMPYIVLFIVLLIRPEGLLGKKQVRRA